MKRAILFLLLLSCTAGVSLGIPNGDLDRLPD